MHMLQTHVPAIFYVFIFILIRFRLFLTVHTYTIRICFHFDPLPIKFSNQWVFDENAHHVSVEGRPTCIEMKALSNKNVSVWKGPKPLEN